MKEDKSPPKTAENHAAPSRRRPDTSGIYSNLASYGDAEFSRYMRRAFLASSGLDRNDLERPIVAIADTTSDYNTCHRDMPSLVAAVKRGVLEAGGLPFAFPTCSLHEIMTSPTTMLYRNLLAMETEEMLRAHPMDAVVLLGGCDKTLPAQLMAAVSANIPALSVVTGPMRCGNWRGERLGACTDCRRLWASYRAGELSAEEISEIELELCSGGGTCMVMGSASTMACLTETLGFMLPGGASPPSGSGARLRHAVQAGRRAVELAMNPIRPREILTRESIENALVVLSALGGSTNAIIHLLAIARRGALPLSLDDFEAVSSRTPLLVDCKPAGRGYMEDFHNAGGVPGLLKVLAPLLNLDTIGATGVRLAELLSPLDPPGPWQSTIRSLMNPLSGTGALAVIKGNLAPDGAMLKRAAASPNLMRHRGPAVVFESPEDVALRIDDPSLELTRDHVLVLRNAGPAGAGMPEAGAIPIPNYLAKQGVRDMVRISDARMSGTAYGTIILHCAKEAARGGPLALVQDGDEIALDVERRRVDLIVPEEELQRRNQELHLPSAPQRGWRRLHYDHVLQAHQGADLDFLL